MTKETILCILIRMTLELRFTYESVFPEKYLMMTIKYVCPGLTSDHFSRTDDITGSMSRAFSCYIQHVYKKWFGQAYSIFDCFASISNICADSIFQI